MTLLSPTSFVSLFSLLLLRAERPPSLETETRRGHSKSGDSLAGTGEKPPQSEAAWISPSLYGLATAAFAVLVVAVVVRALMLM